MERLERHRGLEYGLPLPVCLTVVNGQATEWTRTKASYLRWRYSLRRLSAEQGKLLLGGHAPREISKNELSAASYCFEYEVDRLIGGTGDFSSYGTRELELLRVWNVRATWRESLASD